MSYFNSLFSQYSFKEIVELIIEKIGVSSLIIVLVAFLGIIVYFCTIPSKGRFSSGYSQTNAIAFFQQSFYVLSALMLIMPFISGWIPFLLVFGLYGAIAFPLLLNVINFRKDFSFEDYAQLKNDIFSISHKYLGVGLTWLAIIGELFLFLYFDIKIPLLGWGIIAYTFATAFLMSALTQSILFNATTCPYCTIITDGGIVEGLIIAKGEDNYLVKTKENSDFLLSTDYVKVISPTELPKNSAKTIQELPSKVK